MKKCYLNNSAEWVQNKTQWKLSWTQEGNLEVSRLEDILYVFFITGWGWTQFLHWEEILIEVVATRLRQRYSLSPHCLAQKKRREQEWNKLLFTFTYICIVSYKLYYDVIYTLIY